MYFSLAIQHFNYMTAIWRIIPGHEGKCVLGHYFWDANGEKFKRIALVIVATGDTVKSLRSFGFILHAMCKA